MELEIFDVEHGACALLTCANGTRMMIDCGHNGETGWRPGTHLRRSGVSYLDMLVITNYDEDHVSGFDNLFAHVEVGWLWRNKSVTSSEIRHLKSEYGMGPGIERLVHAVEHTFTGDGSAPQPNFQGVVSRVYCNTYPTFDDENNLSLALHLNCHGMGVLFPGDLERAGWQELLKRPDFRSALASTDILVASHHGRESGCCHEVFDYCNPRLIVISDKGHEHATQFTVPWYAARARGAIFRGERRWVATTRSDGAIRFQFSPAGWTGY